MQMEAVAIPAIAQENHAYDLGRGRSYTFRAGEVLHPELLDAEELASRRRCMGAADFSAQYRQDPLPNGGGALDFSMHRRFEHAPSNLMIFHSWDTARTAGAGDFTVGVKAGYADENYFILDMYVTQLDFTQVVRVIHHKMHVDQPAWTIIEAADGSGDAVHRTLVTEYGVRNIYIALWPQEIEGRQVLRNRSDNRGGQRLHSRFCFLAEGVPQSVHVVPQQWTRA
jgi:hypothetical protein